MTADGAQSTLVDRGLESDSVEKIYINKQILTIDSKILRSLSHYRPCITENAINNKG